MKKYLLLASVFTIFCFSANSQSIAAFKSRLSAPSDKGGNITIIEHGDVPDAVNALNSAVRKDMKVRCYRIVIFSDNGQNARAMAGAASSKFKEMYPDIPITQKYDAPSFKVIAGNFISEEDAIVVWAKVKETFKGATILRESAMLSTLLSQ